MNDDSQGAGQRRQPFRYLLFSLAALLVLSLGFTLIPAEPPPPEPPSGAEIARSAALGDALQLRTAGGHLAARAGRDAAAAAAAGHVVTLLTVQARALLLPGEDAPAGVPAAGASVPPEGAPESLAGLARDLTTSGALRLQAAEETADGGMARLLAGIGSAQLLAAERLHVAAGGSAKDAAAHEAAARAAAEREDPAHGSTTGEATPSTEPAQCPSPTTTDSSVAAPPTPELGTGTDVGKSPAAPAATTAASAAGTAPADLPAALSAVLLAEREVVYAYEAAMPRLAPEAAGPASAILGRHRGLAREAETRLLLTCRPAPPQQPGYAIDAKFLQAPASGLGRLEAGTLAQYGDLVALSEGGTRKWAVAALRAAAARTVHWGADPGPLPGLPIDPGQLQELPGLTGLTEPSGQPEERVEQ